MKHKQSRACPRLHVCIGSGRLTPASAATSDSEHGAGVFTQLILETLEYGAPGLGCNQGRCLSTVTVFDLENSESDG